MRYCNKLAAAMTHHATRTLQDLGYRLTPQRTLVWDVLRLQDAHLSADEVCQKVQEHFPHVNISTVYRTLDLLVELGLVRETCLGPNRRFYEVEEETPHHHLVCGVCGRVIHIHDQDLGDLKARLWETQGFEPREITAFGVCRTCAQTTEAAGGQPA
jgi:Fur family transcriptional regulator, ferric uptake regulator